MQTRPPLFGIRSAFTLIELITVIAIIAILMSLLLPVLASIRNTARRSKASTVEKAIVNACKNYANDYGKYPPVVDAFVKGDDDGYYSFGDTQSGKCRVTNNYLFDVLRAISKGPNTGNALNQRRQSYFEEAKATDSSNPREGFADGKDFPDGVQGQLLDPWGKQYCILLHFDRDGFLKLNGFFSDLTEPIRNSAVVFSMAKDGEIGGKGYPGRLRPEHSSEAPEDVISWE